MALSKEQFLELRKKGLTVDQITRFESGQTPQEPPQQTQQRTQPQLGTMEGFIDPFKQTGIGISKGVGKLALGVGTLGRSIQEGVARVAGQDLKEDSIFDVGSEQRAKADEALKGDTSGQKIASTLTEIGATAIPGGATYKATKGLGFAMRMLGRGASGATVGTIQGGGELGKETLLGAAAETILPGAAKTVAKYGGDVMKGLTGLVSGKGSDVIEQIVKNPDAALSGGNAPSSTVLREIAGSIRGGVSQIKSKAGAEFQNLTKGYTTPLDKKAFNELTSNFLDEVNETSFISTAKLDKIKGVVNTWDDYSPQGLNKLASKISKFYSGSDAAKDTDAVVAGLNRTIRDWIGEQVPDIAEANAKYADKMDLLEQMDAIFRVKGSVEGRLGMQKTAEAIGRLFNANKDIAREGVEEIEKELGISILGKEAGRQLVDGVSRSQSAIGDFATGVAKAVLPPKVLLQLTARTGQATNAITSKLDTLEPAARAATIELLTDLFGDEEATKETDSGTNQ